MEPLEQILLDQESFIQLNANYCKQKIGYLDLLEEMLIVARSTIDINDLNTDLNFEAIEMIDKIKWIYEKNILQSNIFSQLEACTQRIMTIFVETAVINPGNSYGFRCLQNTIHELQENFDLKTKTIRPNMMNSQQEEEEFNQKKIEKLHMHATHLNAVYSLQKLRITLSWAVNEPILPTNIPHVTENVEEVFRKILPAEKDKLFTTLSDILVRDKKIPKPIPIALREQPFCIWYSNYQIRLEAVEKVLNTLLNEGPQPNCK